MRYKSIILNSLLALAPSIAFSFAFSDAPSWAAALNFNIFFVGFMLDDAITKAKE